MVSFSIKVAVAGNVIVKPPVVQMILSLTCAAYAVPTVLVTFCAVPVVVMYLPILLIPRICIYVVDVSMPKTTALTLAPLDLTTIF